MTAAFTRGKVYYGRTPHPDGGSVIRRLSRDKDTAKAMERMLKSLRDTDETTILRAIIDKRRTVAQVYAAWPHGLKELKASLNDRDIEPLVSKWQATIASKYATGDTAQQYYRQVRSLIAEGEAFPLSHLTVERIEAWLYALAVASGTKLRYHAAMSSFCDYLKRTGVIERNPMRDVPSPKPSAPRVRYLSLPDVLRLVRGQAQPFRAAEALSHCGLELSAIRRVRKRDVNEARHTVRAKGTKAESRDRICYVPDWAWGFVVEAMKDLHPDALLVPYSRTPIDRSHREACEALKIEDYRFHDGRHSYAVRMIRAGTPMELVARQLGHTDLRQVMRCYGRFRPTEDDAARWEKIAALRDAEDTGSQEKRA